MLAVKVLVKRLTPAQHNSTSREQSFGVLHQDNCHRVVRCILTIHRCCAGCPLVYQTTVLGDWGIGITAVSVLLCSWAEDFVL
jgi:hypothetical protein